MKYPSYPKYKPSGVEWLGDVPEHWKVIRLKFSLRRIQQGWSPQCENSSADEGEWGVLKVGAVNGSTFDASENKLLPSTEAPLPEFEIKAGDFLISRANTRELLGSAALVSAVRRRLLLCDKLYRLEFRQGSIDPKFVLCFIRSSSGRFEFERDATGSSDSMQNIAQQSVRDLWIPFPPIQEQRTIAEFLDRETARIDTLVAKKRALVERLKEKRTALISRTVTRGLPPDAARAAGLDPHPKLKSSGVEWLGDIPEHWDVKPVKFIASVGNGSTPSRENADFWEDGSYPWLNSSVVNEAEVTQAIELVTPLALRECHLPQITPPAILIGITGEGRTRGMATTLRIEATINQHLAFVKPRAVLQDVRYLRRVFDRAYQFLRNESSGGGSTKGAITCDQIANLPTPIPPHPEQCFVADYLDGEITKIDRMTAQVEAVIERLQEYRTALITAAVTGKIDVRARTLPNQIRSDSVPA